MTAYYNEFDPKAAAWLRECYSTYIGGRIYQSVYGECIMTTDYETYRGRCKELCEMALLEKPELIMVRGSITARCGVSKNIGGLKTPTVTSLIPQSNNSPLKGLPQNTKSLTAYVNARSVALRNLKKK